MYSALPRWSDAANTTGAACQRVGYTAVLSPGPTRGSVEASSPVITPPLTQAQKTSRAGRLFVNHNAPPSTTVLPRDSSMTTSSSPLGAISSPPPRPALGSRGPLIKASRPVDIHMHGTSDGVLVAAASDVPLTTMSGSPLVPRPTFATDRRGIFRGSTLPAMVDTSRDLVLPLSLGVEGVQTGEEVLVDPTVARRRSNPAPTSPDQAQLQLLRRQLDKVTADLKASTNANRRHKQEHQTQRAEWQLLMNECETRLRNFVASQSSRERILSQAFTDTVRCLHNDIHSSEARARNAAQGQSDERIAWQDERAALLRELEAARTAAAAQASTIDSAAADKLELERLRAEMKALQGSFAEQQRQLEERLAQTQSALQKSEAKLDTFQKERDQQNYLVAQCRLFIQLVCQPGFCVVKGPSLEPVEKDRQDPTGFVLVPLATLLHGYALLPEDDRQAVIDHYDEKAKSL